MTIFSKKKKTICHICGRNDGTKKYGVGAAGQQRYYCMHCNKTFQTTYIYKGKEFNIAAQVEALWEKHHTPEQISTELQVPLVKVKSLVMLLEEKEV